MINKYRHWIINNVPFDIQDVWGKCTEYVPKMKEAFPELTIKKGIVYSTTNPDNYPNVYKEYSHMWLLDENDTIIDPTIKQFELIGELTYVSAPEGATVINICPNCSRYFYHDDYLCSEKCVIEYNEYCNKSN